MGRRKAIVTSAAVAGAVTVGLFGQFGTGKSPAAVVVHRASLSLTPTQHRLLSGGSEQALISLGALPAQAATPQSIQPDLGGDSEGNGPVAGTSVGGPVAGSGISGGPANVIPDGTGRCSVVLGGNVKVNQDCENASDPALHGRAQAQNETPISANPNNPRQVIAASNDYRRGDGGCGAYFSQDGARTWNGGLAPHGFTVPGATGTSTRQYWQAGGDTDVSWDSSGTAFLQCQVFNRGLPTSQDPDVSSGILMFRSDNAGASFDFAGRPVVVSSDNKASGTILEDKPLMAVDQTKGSPFRDRIYVSWTEFRQDGTAPILLAYSKDHGETFSKPVLVSTASSLCPNSAVGHGNCDANQFSKPFVAPDGTLYDVFANFNNQPTSGDGTCTIPTTPTPSNVPCDNRNQMLIAKSTDGGNSFGPVVKAADYYDLPDCVTYTGQDAGRACVPVKGKKQTSFFRATNYPSAVVDPRNSKHIIVNYGSYINRNSNESNGCVPMAFNPATGANLYSGVTTPGACNNDIQQSESQNGGTSFTGTTTDPRQMPSVNQDGARDRADQFWQWTAIFPDGTPTVSFYDRRYGQDEFNGFSDISTVNGNRESRTTTGSMPPPTQFSGLFLGDYIGTTVSGNAAIPSWADTRDIGITSCSGDVRRLCRFGQDEDDFAARVGRDGGDGGDSGGGGNSGGGGGGGNG